MSESNNSLCFSQIETKYFNEDYLKNRMEDRK